MDLVSALSAFLSQAAYTIEVVAAIISSFLRGARERRQILEMNGVGRAR